MARIDRTRRVAREQAGQYRATARSFLVAADALETLATDDEAYSSAIGLLAIHACISHSDALAISYGNMKSVGAHDHSEMVLASVLGPRFPKAQRTRLLRVVSQKDAIAYQGRYYPLSEARKLLSAARGFAVWAERMFEERP